MKRKLAFCLFILWQVGLSAQTPADAIMMNDGQLCVAGIYTNESWDEYWEATLLRDNGNIGTFTRHSFTPMAALGIGNYLNIMVAAPYVSTQSDGGYIKGVSGFQDWGLWLKAKALDITAGKGDLTFHATAGMNGPLSEYHEDYAPYSLGLGCLDFSLRGILQYKLSSGPYLRGHAAYQVRSNAKIDRDYYYTTHGIYSNVVDMPNAINYGFNLGSWFFNNSFRAEVTFDGMSTFGGFDIRRQDAGFPANKMVFTRVGGFVQYHAPFGIGFLASAGQVLSGRNVGKTFVYSAGLTYVFGLWNKAQTETIDN